MSKKIQTPTTRKLTRELPVKFTEDEKAELAEQLAEAHADIQQARDRKADVSKQLAADLQSAESKANTLARKYRDGYEYRTVECEEIVDEELRKVTVYRTDTGQTIETRPLPPQMEFQTT